MCVCKRVLMVQYVPEITDVYMLLVYRNSIVSIEIFSEGNIHIMRRSSSEVSKTGRTLQRLREGKRKEGKKERKGERRKRETELFTQLFVANNKLNRFALEFYISLFLLGYTNYCLFNQHISYIYTHLFIYVCVN